MREINLWAGAKSHMTLRTAHFYLSGCRSQTLVLINKLLKYVLLTGEADEKPFNRRSSVVGSKTSVYAAKEDERVRVIKWAREFRLPLFQQ